jgi:protein YIPF5/7
VDGQSEWDMGGPLAIVSLMGFFLMLSGKLHFGYLYGIGIVGCVAAWLLVNAISPKGGIDLYTTVSILGYGLLPAVLLSAIAVVVELKSGLGMTLAAVCIMWCTATASRFFSVGIDLENQRWLVAYPIALIYVCFATLAVF